MFCLKTIWWLQSGQHYQIIISNIRRRECYNEWGERNLYSLTYDQNFDWYAPGIFHFLIGQWRRDANRLEICRNRRGRRSCTIFSICIIFFKQCVPLLNLCRSMKFTHLIGEFLHTFFFSPKLFNFYTLISISTKQGQKSFFWNKRCLRGCPYIT